MWQLRCYDMVDVILQIVPIKKNGSLYCVTDVFPAFLFGIRFVSLFDTCKILVRG